jgi:ribosomal-protein-alanine N-acetyltransferase
MSEALRLVVHHGFTRCGLHRIEAACIPGNARSIALLERAGFTAEGTLKSYLRINGQWADHILYARINPNAD